jgi:uncharacterized caspase-like protein
MLGFCIISSRRFRSLRQTLREFCESSAAREFETQIYGEACHSGAAGEQQRRGDATDDLVRDLISEDYGIVVLSSSRGHEYSLESPKAGHGFFTLALVEGLEGRADFNRDGYVYLNEIDRYTLRRVRELSAGQQTPVLSRPRTVRSFPLAMP